MNSEEDEFRRIEREALRRAAQDDDDDTQVYTSDAIAFVAEWKAAQRQWQGLEAEDLAQIESDEFWQVKNHMAIAMAVEAKLKERNHD